MPTGTADDEARRLRELRLEVTRLANEGGEDALPDIAAQVVAHLGWPWARVLHVGPLGHLQPVHAGPGDGAADLDPGLAQSVDAVLGEAAVTVAHAPAPHGAFVVLPIMTLSRVEDVLLLGLPDDGPAPDAEVLASLDDVRAQTEVLLERRRISRELERSNEELARFAYVASHDLQEPLRKITGFLGLLEERYADQLDDDAREYIGFAVGGATRMQLLISDLLTYARIGRAGQALAVVDLDELVADVLEGFGLEPDRVHVTPLPAVVGYRPELRQLFENLLGNAVKFAGPDGPDVTVRASEQPGRVVVEVLDTGIGIPEDQLHKVFDPFFRGHPARRYGGTGVGLAICRKVVEHHDGTIDIASVPGEGTTVRIELPGAPT